MRIGIIVDGAAESQALKLLTRRIHISKVEILDPIYANVQPKSTPRQIARSAKSRIGILTARRVDKIVLLIDREDRKECPTQFARDIEAAFSSLGHNNIKVTVKNRRFENWLIADVDVFKRMKARYNTTVSFENAVVPNKADSVLNAEALINKICKGGDYHKRKDAAQITQSQNISAIARNSRSFRKFLRTLQHPDYTEQSKLPK